ncbi:MAG: VanW family protein [Dorea sp.]|nr:VanW family protein [Dorea sp.]
MKRVVISIVAVMAAAGYLACCAAVNQEHLLPHTSVNGIDIGGMETQEAVDLLEKEAASRQNTAIIPVRFKQKEYAIPVGEALEWEYEPAVEELQKQTRSAFFIRGFFLIKSFLGGNSKEVLPVIKNEELLEEAIEASGLSSEGTTKQTVYRAEKDGLVFTIGTAGQEANSAKLKEELKTAILADDYTVIECPVSLGRVDEADLDLIYQEIYQEPENATLDPENNYQIKESVTGIRFDKENARKILETAKEGSTVTVEYIKEVPEITTADLKEHLFSDKLASYRTEVRGTANRKDNISLATAKCDGVILVSGDIFSYNNTVGEQTAQTGYKLANATMDGQVVQAYGGGICQVSSTIFAAALYSNLEIRERWEHEFVSSYIDAGMDAAVAWDMLDLKICNNKEYPIRIDVAYVDDILTVDIWGTKTDDAIVEVDTEVIDDSDGKLSVQTTRRVYYDNKNRMFVEQIADSVYLN